MYNHWVVPGNCRGCSFLGNMGGSTNPVALLTLPPLIDTLHLTNFPSVLLVSRWGGYANMNTCTNVNSQIETVLDRSLVVYSACDAGLC